MSLTDMVQDRLACGVLTVDHQGKIVALNPLAKRLMNPPGPPEQASPAGTLPSPIRTIVDEVQKSGKAVAAREINLWANGAAAGTLSVTALPLSPEKPGAGVVLLLKDISSTQKLEQHMQRLDRLASIGTLSASMAHEIKNAFVPVKTFIDLLLEKDPGAELAETVRREMQRVDAIISGMLKFAAPSKPTFAPVRLHQLLEHSLHLVQHRAEGKRIAFDRQFNTSWDSCNGDAHQLEQALVNLLLNAVEAMSWEGTLTVSTDLVSPDPELPSPGTTHPPGFLRVEITDTGTGIPPDKINFIFEPFFTTKPHGTGLGLAVTRRIIEEHNGIIRVKSEPGKGTTFTVLLPVPATG
jgi:signal transduction histidine kinase